MSEMETVQANQRLAWSFSALLRGMLYPGSEGDSPYKPFHVWFDSSEALSAESFRAANGLARFWDVDLQEESTFFDKMISISSANDSTGQEPRAYEYLRQAMTGTMPRPLFVAVADAPDDVAFHCTRHYVFGRVPEGGLAGIVAFSVET